MYALIISSNKFGFVSAVDALYNDFLLVHQCVCLVHPFVDVLIWVSLVEQVSLYLLGEYSHLVARQPGCSPKKVHINSLSTIHPLIKVLGCYCFIYAVYFSILFVIVMVLYTELLNNKQL